MNELTPELIRTEFIDKVGSFTDVASKYTIPVKELEDYCFALCKSHPEEFDYKHFLTKEWFSDKLSKFDSLIEIANETGIHYRTLCYFKQKFFPEKRRRLSDEISYETLCKLYLEDELTDKTIAEMYNTNITGIKRLRQAYDIMRSDRVPLEQKLPIELFHRIYVVSKLGLGQIASLYNAPRKVVTALRDKYAQLDHPLSNDICNTNNTGSSPRFLEELLQHISKEDLCRELKTKTIFEIASRYKLVAPTANGHQPLSREWLKAELMSKSTLVIAKENNITQPRLSELIKEYGLDSSARTEHIGESTMRELFINRCWSDATIAKHLGVSPATVRKERLGYRIFSDQRPSERERVSPELMKYLHSEEGMSLMQIGNAYNIADRKIRELRKEYVSEGHAELAHRPPHRITPERLEYLYKQIRMNLLKK